MISGLNWWNFERWHSPIQYLLCHQTPTDDPGWCIKTVPLQLGWSSLEDFGEDYAHN